MKQLTNDPSKVPETRVEMIKYYGELFKNGEDLFLIGHQLGLTKQQIAFVEHYMNPEYVGSSGREAAALAYGYNLNTPSGKAAASSIATKNLKHLGILNLIAIVHNAEGFNDEWVDRRLKFIMDQNSDLKSALMAISEYNKLHQRIKTITEVHVKQTMDFSTLSPDELNAWIKMTERIVIKNDERKITDIDYEDV